MSVSSAEDLEPDLTLIETGMYYGQDEVFWTDMKEHNLPFYNFFHHLLFTGWAENDCYRSPGFSPYRGNLIGDKNYDGYWNGGHRENFYDMSQVFLCLHKCNEERMVPPRSMLTSGWESPKCTLSQIQYMPETIRRCVENCVDLEARSLLGKSMSDSIDLYRLVRETYEAHKDDLSCIQWMPSLGVPLEDFVPLTDFTGYNPQHKNDNIDYTGLVWGVNDDVSDA